MVYLHALETWTRSNSYVFAHSVSVSVDQTTGSPSCSSVSVGKEMWWHHSCGRSGSGCHVDRCGLSNGTFISRTTETVNVLLVASEYGRWTALLQTDYVTSETETEIARVVPGYLLSWNVYFAAVSVLSKSKKCRLI